jgi:dipeptide/tripeptide permease
MILALATGIIKPIIVSFVGDQFDLPKQQNQWK